MITAENFDGDVQPPAKRPHTEPENEHFRVEDRVSTDADGVTRRQSVLVILTCEGARAVRQHILEEDDRVPPFWIPMAIVLHQLPRMRGRDYPEQTPALVRAIEPAYEGIRSQAAELRAHGRARYDLLWVLFPPDALVTWTDEFGDAACGRVVSAKYLSQRPPHFRLKVQVLGLAAACVTSAVHDLRVPEFDERPLCRMHCGLHLLEEADPLFGTLVARGKRWLSLATGVHVMTCAGALVSQGFFGDRAECAKGRCVIDSRGYSDVVLYGRPAGVAAEVDTRAASVVATAPPRLPGYSLVLHEWGTMRVDDLASTVFNRAALDELVLPAERKEAVRATVASAAAIDVPDVIAGKGGGAVILLYGPPGTGKTLTAEAVAEYLERPLLFVRAATLVGAEAGTKLGRFLALAHRWNGVVLVDEADVLLMRRDAGASTRNALVADMLVALERHDGVVILTTNRVGDFDPAVASRINFGLKYDPLDPRSRCAVWAVQLRKAAAAVRFADGRAVVDLDADGVQAWAAALAHHAINGRVIRTAIKIACSTAWHRTQPLTLDTLRKVVEQQVAFQADVASVDGHATYE
ncbi:MAG TPA: AAA family ATPase [Ramlibacter sp.]|nr:AAA family ATPase [Ramlibacter sp.]